MRKLLWAGIALMVCASAGIYVLARHASRHPEIFYQRAVQVVREARTGEPAAPEQGTEFVPDLDIDITPSGRYLQHPPQYFPPTPPSTTPDVVESIVIENREEGVQPVVNQVRTGPIFVPGGEETSEPPIIPIILPRERIPEYMPYADEPLTPPGQPSRSKFFGWLACDNCPKEEACGTDWCTWVLDVLEGLWQILQGPTPAAEVQEIPTFGPPPQEIRPPFGLPNFREDPNYHHHYPSCPHMGGCTYPYYYRHMKPVQPVQPVQPMPETPPAVPSPAPKASQAPSSTPAPAQPAHSHLDTLECRPSDLPAAQRNQAF